MKKIIALTLAVLMSVVPAYASDYNEALSDLKDLRIMVGSDDGLMHEEDYLSRSEAITVIMRTIGFDDGKWYKAEVKKFDDVPLSHWASGYIYKAVNNGIVDGATKENFLPSENVTLAQSVKMVVELIKADDEDLPYPNGYMEKAKELELLNGISCSADDYITRGEFAILVHNALDIKLPDGEGALREKLNLMLKAEVPDIEADYDGVTSATGSVGGGSSASAERAESSMMKPTAPSAMKPETDVAEKPVTDGDIYMPPIPDNQEVIESGQLTAGKWNDIENYAFWRSLMANGEYSEMQRRWDIPTDKYEVIVKNGEMPAKDCTVKLVTPDGNILCTSKTDKNGLALVFAQADEQQNTFNIITISPDGTENVTENVMLDPENPLEISAEAAEPENVVDLMFTIDTTGSMSDELRYINAELTDVVNSLDTNVRLSCNYYRDTTDIYTVKPFDFTTNVENAVYQMSQQYAGGGGDYEEAVDLALLNSVNEHDWSENAKARLLFLVLDAPPHFTPEIVENINAAVKAASEKGIRIIPIASSGVDKNTEFFLRSLAIATNGRYIFLTDDSGIGLSHIEPTIGDYTVEYLNNLIIETIHEYID